MKWSLKKKVAGLLFVLPWIAGFLIFTLYPLVETLVYSFSKVRIEFTGVAKSWVGLANYNQVLFENPDFMVELPGYVQQILLFVPMTLVFSVLLSLMLNQKIKGKRFFRAVYFLPVILMCGPLLTNIIQMDATKLNGVQQFILYRFIEEYCPEIIATPLLYIFNNIVLILWFCGIQILIFLSGLQKMDTSVYEAARVDGANSWQQFWKITLPTLKPFIFINAIYAIVDISSSSLNQITQIIEDGMFSTTKGFGFSAAASYLYFIVTVLFVLLAFLLFGRGEKKIKEKKPRRVRRKEKAA